jgi:hypothetical protein
VNIVKITNNNTPCYADRTAPATTEAKAPPPEPDNPFCLKKQVENAKSKMDVLERDSAPGQARTDLRDNSGRIMQRLAGAQTGFDVRWVIAEASAELLSLNMAAAGNCDTAKLARAYAERMRSVLRRADRKLSDLSKEERLQREKAVEIRRRQEQQLKKNDERVREHNERIREIGNDLHSRRSERRNRESRWLLGTGDTDTMPLMFQKGAVALQSIQALQSLHFGSAPAISPSPEIHIPMVDISL